MDIYKVNKIMASENKSKLITHFWTCNCRQNDVHHMVKKLNISQPNLSKHLLTLLDIGILNCEVYGKQRFYYINKEWKEEWYKIIEPQIYSKENISFICSCSKKQNDKIKT